MINPDALLTCAEFRDLNAKNQANRRAKVLPLLKARQNALKRQIDALRLLADWMGVLPIKGLAWREFQSALTHNHRRDGLLKAAHELYPEYSEVCGQIAVIEPDVIPAKLRKVA
jgi:hypothetical protein